MSDHAESVKVWDLPLRLFHWFLVVSVAVAFLSAEEGSPLDHWHVLSGWVAGILIIFRIAWGLIGGEHSRFANFIHPSRIGHHLHNLRRHGEPSLGHNPLGAMAVIILLGLTGTVVWTGAFGGEAAEEMHEIVGWTLLAMVGIHVAAVVVMSRLDRENLVRAMVTGNKPRARHPNSRDAWPPSLWAFLVGFAVLAASAYAVLQYDPIAFTARSSESVERRGDSAGSVRTEETEAHED